MYTSERIISLPGKITIRTKYRSIMRFKLIFDVSVLFNLEADHFSFTSIFYHSGKY